MLWCCKPGLETVNLLSLPIGDAEHILLFKQGEGMGHTPLAICITKQKKHSKVFRQHQTLKWYTNSLMILRSRPVLSYLRILLLQ